MPFNFSFPIVNVSLFVRISLLVLFTDHPSPFFSILSIQRCHRRGNYINTGSKYNSETQYAHKKGNRSHQKENRLQQKREPKQRALIFMPMLNAHAHALVLIYISFSFSPSALIWKRAPGVWKISLCGYAVWYRFLLWGTLRSMICWLKITRLNLFMGDNFICGQRKVGEYAYAAYPPFMPEGSSIFHTIES